MIVAVIVVGIIMIVSFLICICQCYQKVFWEVKNDSWNYNKINQKPMPPAPYHRDISAA